MALDLSISATIYNQLGGNRFKVMTGCHSFSQVDNGIVFKIPKGRYFIIKLNGLDLYDMTYWRNGHFRGDKFIESKLLEERKDVYAEDLQTFFTEMTGLYTSL
jgi:hypothetical protein